jgi:hypothetical protein
VEGKERGALKNGSKAGKIRSTKFESRNPKQIQNMTIKNNYNVSNKSGRNRYFEFSEFGVCLAAVCFGFGASDFGFAG